MGREMAYLLSFAARHAPLIECGVKTRTIRRRGARRAPFVGEALRLYVGLRTKTARLILETPCTAVAPVRLVFDRASGPELFEVDSRRLRPSEFDAFATLDGFDSAADMAGFWFEVHGKRSQDRIDFAGDLIAWHPPLGL